MGTYIFQKFIMFSQPTGTLVELLCFGHPNKRAEETGTVGGEETA